MKQYLLSLLLSFLPVLYWQLLDHVRGISWTWQRPVRLWLLTLAILGLFAILSRRPPGDRSRLFLTNPWVLLGAAALAALGAWVWESTVLAWLFLTIFFAFLLSAAEVFRKQLPRWTRLAGYLLLLLGSGLVPVGLEQMALRFAEEEFFTFLKILVLAGYWFLLLLVAVLQRPLPLSGNSPAGARRAFGLLAAWLVLIPVFGFLLGWFYQQSFYDPAPPGFPGISPETPFLTGQCPPAPDRYEGRQVFRGLLEQAEGNPVKSSADYGLLALAKKDPVSRQSFRTGLLREADEGRFTTPAHSVKFGQYEAALRIYYFLQVNRLDPRLFSPEEKRRLASWFQAVNRRAQTREWVDFLYGLAFSACLEGPYENQEIGAGLLALLEYAGLSDPGLRLKNREYLALRLRGWEQRFRNTDDAYIYQTEWLHNAFFQQLYHGRGNEAQRRLSFEWLLLQALPDGAAPDYNMPAKTPLAETAYLGAILLQDSRLLWLAGRALDRCRSEGRPIQAAPGLETEVGLTGFSPTAGSCLLYGNSGLPTRPGPLAPDKIVFRDGWKPDSLYLLLNLRFAGWHRYKATNTVTLLYQKRALTGDRLEAKSFDWLPAGRRVFRDKRIPREYLNGLVVERVGLSRVLFDVTALGSPWTQDPPRSAVVEAFETGPERDHSTTVIKDWHGWEHRRHIQFQHGGPVVITDTVSGPAQERGAILWHFPAGTTVEKVAPAGPGRGGTAGPVLVKVSPEALRNLPAEKNGMEKEIRLEAREGRLQLITVFLTGPWGRAGVDLEGPPGGLRLRVSDGGHSLSFPMRFY